MMGAAHGRRDLTAGRGTESRGPERPRYPRTVMVEVTQTPAVDLSLHYVAEP